MATEKVLGLGTNGIVEKEITTGGVTGAIATLVPISLTVGQTSVPVPGGYTTAGVICFLNGAYLTPAEYTATDLITVVLAIGAPSTGSILDVIVFTDVAIYTLPPNLASLAALVGSADKGLHFTALNTLALHTLTAQGITFLAAVDAAAQRAVIGAGNQLMQLATAQATTSGTFKDFLSIPSWAKKITITLDDFSTSGTSNYLIQLGTSSGIDATGYDADAVSCVAASSVASSAQSGTGLQFTIGSIVAANTIGSGRIDITNITGNLWQMSSSYSTRVSFFSTCIANTAKTLSGVLDRIRITTVGGTDTLDSGSAGVLIEGYS